VHGLISIAKPAEGAIGDLESDNMIELWDPDKDVATYVVTQPLREKV
jgi:hypothetical protein